MGVEKPTIRKITGDGLTLRLRSNEQILEVTGDGCRVTMLMNHGSVKIMGDGCRLTIDQNMGDVEYTGDGGQVLLGPKSIRDKVKYVGDGGRVRFDWVGRVKDRKSTDGSKKEDLKGLNEGREGSGKGMDGLRREEVENLLNGIKEAKRGGFDGEKKKERSTRTRIVTIFECDEKMVEKWFVNPETVVETLDAASFAKTMPKLTKTKIVVK